MMCFVRVLKAEMSKNFKQYFFSARTLYWAIMAPFANGLYLYFLYLPFSSGNITLAVGPSVFVLDLIGFTLVGQVLFSFFMMMILSGGLMDREREQGTLEMMFLTPANRYSMALGAIFSNAVNYTWMISGTLVAWVLFLKVPLRIGDPSALALSILMSYFSLIALGISLEALFIHSRRGILFASISIEPTMFFSGLVFPLQSLPVALAQLGFIVPLTLGLLTVRATLLGGASLAAIYPALVGMLLSTVAYFLLARFVIRYAEDSAKKKASLAEF